MGGMAQECEVRFGRRASRYPGAGMRHGVRRAALFRGRAFCVQSPRPAFDMFRETFGQPARARVDALGHALEAGLNVLAGAVHAVALSLCTSTASSASIACRFGRSKNTPAAKPSALVHVGRTPRTNR